MEGSTGVRFLWHLKAAQVRLFPLGFISSPTFYFVPDIGAPSFSELLPHSQEYANERGF